MNTVTSASIMGEVNTLERGNQTPPSFVYRLRLPGPTRVPERVQRAIARPVVNHRGPEFRNLLGHVEELIRPVLGTRSPVLFFACTGTGVMEASIANVVSPGERMLVLLNGQFSERFVAIGRALGANVDVLEVAWGDCVDPSLVDEYVSRTRYRAVVVVHNESSTGIVHDIAGIGAVLRNRPTLLIVDSVSALGGLEMRQDEWGADIVVAASQKALMCPPGLGIVSLSSKALEVVNRDNGCHRFYWDFRKALNSAEKRETPFTAPVSLIAGLEEALMMILEEGLPQVLARHRRLSTALRAGCAALGLSGFGNPQALSNTVVVVNVPGNLSGGDIVKGMYERHHAVIAGARNKLSGRIIRIGTMGDLNAADIFMDLVNLEDVLADLGWDVAPGVGAATAAAALRTS